MLYRRTLKAFFLVPVSFGLCQNSSTNKDWFALRYLGFGYKKHLAIAWFGTMEVIVRNQSHCYSSVLTFFIMTLFIYVTVFL